MSMEPPPFEEAARCEVCKCSFNTFRRRHHCRSCGRTFCNEHSSNQMALPQFGVHSCVRVCADCVNNSSRSRKDETGDSVDSTAYVIDAVSRLDISPDVNMKTDPTVENHPVLGIPKCECGMPLCICEAPVPSRAALPLQRNSTSTSTAQMSPKSKKINTTLKNRCSASKSKLGSVFNLGQATNGTLDNLKWITKLMGRV